MSVSQGFGIFSWLCHIF